MAFQPEIVEPISVGFGGLTVLTSPPKAARLGFAQLVNLNGFTE